MKIAHLDKTGICTEKDITRKSEVNDKNLPGEAASDVSPVLNTVNSVNDNIIMTSFDTITSRLRQHGVIQSTKLSNSYDLMAVRIACV